LNLTRTWPETREGVLISLLDMASAEVPRLKNRKETSEKTDKSLKIYLLSMNYLYHKVKIGIIRQKL